MRGPREGNRELIARARARAQEMKTGDDMHLLFELANQLDLISTAYEMQKRASRHQAAGHIERVRNCVEHGLLCDDWYQNAKRRGMTD